LFRFSWPFYPIVDIRDGDICGELFKLWNSDPIARGIQNAVLRSVVREDEYVRPVDIVQYCAIGKGKVHPCTGTEALYRPYGP